MYKRQRYHTLLKIVSSTRVPSLFRSAACAILVALFIDREPYESNSPVQYIRTWEEARPPPKGGQASKAVDVWAQSPALRPTGGFADFKQAVHEISFVSSCYLVSNSYLILL